MQRQRRPLLPGGNPRLAKENTTARASGVKPAQLFPFASGPQGGERGLLPAEQWTVPDNGQAPAAVLGAAQTVALAAPTTGAASGMQSGSEQAEAVWLADMQLSPLIDLRALGPALDAPGYGWPRGAATPAFFARGGAPTPAALIRVSVGTPLSQHKGLPHPCALDFGGPSVPPPARDDGWMTGPRPLRHAGAAPTSAAAPPPLPDAVLHPQSKSQPVVIPHVVMNLPLPPTASLGLRGGASASAAAARGFVDGSMALVPVLPPPPQRAPPVAIATAVSFARLNPLPGPVVVQSQVAAAAVAAGATISATAAVGAAAAAAAAAAVQVPAPVPLPVPAPVAAPITAAPNKVVPTAVPSRSQLSDPSAEGGQPTERTRRQRKQRVQCAEFHWSDEEDGAAATGGDSSDGDTYMEGQEEEEVAVTPSSRAPSSAAAAAPNSGSETSTPVGSLGSSVGSSSKKGRSGSIKSSRRRAPTGGASQLQQRVQQAGLLRRIQSLTHLSAQHAASALGCSLTTFRLHCRSVGIQRWPSSRRT